MLFRRMLLTYKVRLNDHTFKLTNNNIINIVSTLEYSNSSSARSVQKEPQLQDARNQRKILASI